MIHVNADSGGAGRSILNLGHLRGPLPLAPHPILTPFRLAGWCSATIGDTKTRIYALMGTPHGTEWAPWAVALAKHFGESTPYAEWDVVNDILVATFENGRVESLDAYTRPIPNPAMDLHCQARRY